MPRYNVILNLPGFTIAKVSGPNPIIIHAKYHRKPRCIHCNSSKLRIKDSFFRQVKHESVGYRNSVLRFKAHKFYCKACQRYFNQQFPGILKYQRATEKLRQQVFREHTEGVSQCDLAKRLDLGKSTIERWFHAYYHLQHQNRLYQHWPRVLGIDEHFFCKKQRFATTFCDLNKHRIFDVVKGRSASELFPFLQNLPGRERVKVACIDLSVTYRNLIKKYFPNALIVSDRFHVLRLVEHAFMQTCHRIIPELKYQRGVLSMLRTRPENLPEYKKDKLQHFLRQNPAIQALYDFKEQLFILLKNKHQTARKCKQLIPEFLDMIKQLKKSIFEPLVKLGKTLYKWREEIARMWRFTKSNGITEGFHRKMKLIQRRAYGFRNFENYRLRVKVLCS
jgi:transposase